MKASTGSIGVAMMFVVFVGISWGAPSVAGAHCDTLDGPVVMAAETALEKGDVTPVLRWVKKEDEGAVREVFQRALAVRGKGSEAKALADMYFFETLVRIHRAGEGAAYTGLKPAGTVEPGVAAADKALENGSADGLVKALTDHIAAGVRERFAHAIEKKKHADESVEAGRGFVEAYVEFIHYVERLHADASSTAGHHEHEGAEAEGGHNH